MNTNGAVFFILAAAMGAAGTVSKGTQFTGATSAQLHSLACATPAPTGNPATESPWSIKNLYDCRTRTLYIPAQLKTGGAWNGAKPGATGDGCGFPAGKGWALSVRRICADSAVEITSIRLNDRNELESVDFNRWRGATQKDGYRYAPGRGKTEAWTY